MRPAPTTGITCGCSGFAPLVVGVVVPAHDEEELLPAHVRGANVAARASAYLAVGGFADFLVGLG
jgi:hypothetical protein